MLVGTFFELSGPNAYQMLFNLKSVTPPKGQSNLTCSPIGDLSSKILKFIVVFVHCTTNC